MIVMSLADYRRQIEKLPTLARGHCCDLKLEHGGVRVWLCRAPKGECLPEHRVNFELFDGRGWRPIKGMEGL